MHDLQALAGQPLQHLQQLCDKFRPPLRVARDVHRPAQLQDVHLLCEPAGQLLSIHRLYGGALRSGECDGKRGQ